MHESSQPASEPVHVCVRFRIVRVGRRARACLPVRPHRNMKHMVSSPQQPCRWFGKRLSPSVRVLRVSACFSVRILVWLRMIRRKRKNRLDPVYAIEGAAVTLPPLGALAAFFRVCHPSAPLTPPGRLRLGGLPGGLDIVRLKINWYYRWLPLASCQAACPLKSHLLASSRVRQRRIRKWCPLYGTVWPRMSAFRRQLTSPKEAGVKDPS